MRRTILALGAVLACVTPGLAQNYAGWALNDAQADPYVLLGSSIQSEASFGLFLDSFDYAAQRPADLALITGDESTRHLNRPATREGDAHILYTNLSNIGTSNTFQAGSVFRAGPGNLVIAAGFSQFDQKTTTDSFGSTFSSRNVSKSDNEWTQVAIGYGWSIGDKGHLGFLYNYADLSQPDSSVSQQFAPSSSTFSTLDDYQITDHDFRFGWRGDPSDGFTYSVGAHAMIRDITDLSRINESDGTVNSEGLEMSGTLWGIDGRFTWYHDDYDVELFADYSTGSYDLDNNVLQNDPGDWFGFSYDYAVDDQFDADMTTIGMRYLRRLGQADLGVGVSLQDASYDFFLAYDSADPGPPPGTPNTRTETWRKQDWFATMIPISARYHFTDKLSVTAGAEFALVQSEVENRDRYTPTADPGLQSEFRTKTEDDTTFTDYRVGLRYELNEHVTGQLMFGRTTSYFFDSVGGFGSTDLIDTTKAAVSVTVQW
ncbi:MAG: hypothetical protein D6718_12985 [Acidobacteria bacterium]|nr:MAG: hypothetical protein D6718_12985 [Acidobacteriota bacterium]